MNTEIIDQTIQQYVENGEIAGGALYVRKGDELIYRGKWGYSDLAGKTPIEYHSIYRMMSMTKPITAVAVMQQIEQGRISLYDPISRFLPDYQQMRVLHVKLPSAIERVFDPDQKKKTGKLSLLSLIPLVISIKTGHFSTLPAERDITIKDLLTHSSGLEQGLYGYVQLLLHPKQRESLAQVAQMYSHYPLDFQPGTAANYSPLAGFDVLARIVEIVTDTPFDIYVQEHIFHPLGMKDAVFRLNTEQQTRLVHVYKREKKELRDVTGTKDDMDGMLHRGKDYIAASGGLYATVNDYERFAHMLLCEGILGEERILKPETVRLMHSAPVYPETEPGYVWGLGMKIRQDPKRGNSPCTQGTYGWSGAFGTHFFVSPADDLEAVWVTNRTDLGGSGSYISKEIERLVFGCFVKENGGSR